MPSVCLFRVANNAIRNNVHKSFAKIILHDDDDRRRQIGRGIYGKPSSERYLHRVQKTRPDTKNERTDVPPPPSPNSITDRPFFLSSASSRWYHHTTTRQNARCVSMFFQRAGGSRLKYHHHGIERDPHYIRLCAVCWVVVGYLRKSKARVFEISAGFLARGLRLICVYKCQYI